MTYFLTIPRLLFSPAAKIYFLNMTRLFMTVRVWIIFRPCRDLVLGMARLFFDPAATLFSFMSRFFSSMPQFAFFAMPRPVLRPGRDLVFDYAAFFFSTMQRKILWPYHNFLAHRRLNFWPCRDFSDHAACFFDHAATYISSGSLYFSNMPRPNFSLIQLIFRTYYEFVLNMPPLFSFFDHVALFFNHVMSYFFDHAAIYISSGSLFFSNMPRPIFHLFNLFFEHVMNLF